MLRTSRRRALFRVVCASALAVSFLSTATAQAKPTTPAPFAAAELQALCVRDAALLALLVAAPPAALLAAGCLPDGLAVRRCRAIRGASDCPAPRGCCR